jgi:multiple sugar transport system substrate-binding protein
VKRCGTVTTALALLAVGLGACSSGGGSTTTQDPNATLEIWIRQAPGSASATTAQRLVDAFTQKTGVKTHLNPIFDDFETKLQQQGAQHQLPDIVINDTAQLGNMRTQGWIGEVDKGKITGASDISERAWDAVKAPDGKYYAVPFNAQAFAILIRADWRKKLGLAEPKTWDDLVAIGDAFANKDPDGNGKKDTSGFVIPGATQRGYMSWYLANFIYANGGDYVTDKGGSKFVPAVTESKTAETVKWLQALFCTKKVVNPDAVTLNTTQAHEVFEKGKGGLYLTGPYMLARFEKNMGAEKIEVFKVPLGPSANSPGVLGEGENVYMMAGSKNVAGQQKFAEFAISAEGQRIGMNKDAEGAIVRLPVNKNVKLSEERKDPRWLPFQEAYENGAHYTPNVPNWAPFRQMTADTFNAVAANCASDVDKALSDLATKMSNELKNQGAFAG